VANLHTAYATLHLTTDPTGNTIGTILVNPKVPDSTPVVLYVGVTEAARKLVAALVEHHNELVAAYPRTPLRFVPQLHGLTSLAAALNECHPLASAVTHKKPGGSTY
jgi:hypothetical protein